MIRYATTHVTSNIAEDNASYSGSIILFNRFIDFRHSDASVFDEEKVEFMYFPTQI